MRKSPFYNEIDMVLGCRDVVTLNHVKETKAPTAKAQTAKAPIAKVPTAKALLTKSKNLEKSLEPTVRGKERLQRKLMIIIFVRQWRV